MSCGTLCHSCLDIVYILWHRPFVFFFKILVDICEATDTHVSDFWVSKPEWAALNALG